MATDQPSLAPTLLVAMPQLEDPNFTRTVVLLCEHHENGSMGLVINRDTDTLASEVVDFDPPPESDSGLEVSIGGPVDPQRGWLLLSERVSDAVEVAPGLFLSASREALREAVAGSRPGRRCRFLIGYAGWGPKQLDLELAASSWLTVPVDPELLFETPCDDVWERAIRRLGIDPTALAMAPGVH